MLAACRKLRFSEHNYQVKSVASFQTYVEKRAENMTPSGVAFDELRNVCKCDETLSLDLYFMFYFVAGGNGQSSVHI